MPNLNPFRWLLAAGLIANALAMIFYPHAWYDTVPGVAYTGPLNTHFVRDIGCAYLVSAGGLAWRAWRGPAASASSLLGAGFLMLHVFVHLGETLAGICGWRSLLHEVPGVVLPALAALALALPNPSHPLRSNCHV